MSPLAPLVPLDHALPEDLEDLLDPGGLVVLLGLVDPADPLGPVDQVLPEDLARQDLPCLPWDLPDLDLPFLPSGLAHPVDLADLEDPGGLVCPEALDLPLDLSGHRRLWNP